MTGRSLPWPTSSHAILALAAVAYCVMTLFRLGSFDVVPDEGRFGISALNILGDVRQLAIVSQEPLGEPGTMPYLYPVSLMVPILLLGRTELALRIVNVIALLVAAGLLYGTFRRLTGDVRVAAIGSALFIVNPGTVVYARYALPEPMVLAWGCVSLYAAIRFVQGGRLAWAAAVGGAWGAAFLCKLWLVFPFVVAAGGVMLYELLRRREARALIGLALASVTAVAVAASHLIFVMLLAPEYLDYWREIYVGFTLSRRVGGVGFDPDMWYRPWWFYPAAAFKAVFFALPALFLGLHSSRVRYGAATAIVLGGLAAPLVVFSLFKVKQASYIYGAYPTLAFLIAAGFLYGVREAGPRVRYGAVAGSIVIAIAFAMGDVLSPRELIGVVAIYLLYVVGWHVRAAWQPRARVLTIGVAIAAMTVANIAVIKRTLAHRTYYREISRFMSDRVETRPARDVAFVAPEFPSLAFYTFRRGHYWETYYFQQSDEQFGQAVSEGTHAFYVVDPSRALYGSRISDAKLAVLKAGAVDVTADIERSLGARIGLQVFVPARSIQ